MRLLRFAAPTLSPRYGWLFEDQIGEIDGDPFGGYRRLDPEHPLEGVKLLPPVLPGKIVCIGRNYAAHAQELNHEVSEAPVIFLKPGTSLVGPGDPIVLPPQSHQVQHEAELAAVIGRRGRWIDPDEALAHIYGYTIANDVTARDLQQRDTTWTRGKGFDTFCPLGPWIDTDLDPSDVVITCHVGEEMRQMASTRDMVFNIPQLVAFVSSVMTLEPGDLILTGTPAGVGDLTPGVTVAINIEGLGTLTNPVTAEGEAPPEGV